MDLNKIVKRYFEIPRKYRFLIYYIIAFIMFVNKDWENANIRINIGLGEYIKNLPMLPVYLQSVNPEELAQYLLIFFLGLLVIVLLFIWYSMPVTILYFVERNVMVRIKRENGNYSVEENISYYRELLDNVSPGVVSVIDDLKTGSKKDLAAGILKLNHTGHVKFENNRFVPEDNSKEDDLSESQKVLFYKVRDGLITPNDIGAWREASLKEAVEEGYLNKRSENSIASFIIKGMLKILLGYFGIFFGLFIASSFPILGFFIIVGLMLFIGFYPMYYIGYIFFYLTHKSPYRYTEKGLEVKRRIEGLKKFIEDYSSLDEKGKQEVVLWDDYLIYAVLFEQNTKIVKDIFKLKGLELYEEAFTANEIL